MEKEQTTGTMEVQNDDERAREALSRWTNLNMSRMCRILRGQGPYPPKKEKATKDRWKTLPMPKRHYTVELGIDMDERYFQTIEMGHIPAEMEDHWFMYCSSRHIRWYRSWTGICIFSATYRRHDGYVTLETLEVNGEPDQFSVADEVAAANLFLALMAEETGVDSGVFWNEFWNRTK